MTGAQKVGVLVQPFHARDPDQIREAFQAATRNQLQAMIVFDDPVIWTHRKEVVAAASNARLPAMYGYSEFVLDGGLISYGPHRPDLYRRTALYVDKILKGAKPADLAVERPTKFELLVNSATAKALGLTIPQAILLQADRVIE
jgi:putative ABC transport system substrate-binding protein